MRKNEIVKLTSQAARSTLSSIGILRSKDKLMEEILSKDNLKQAFARVQANKGCAGIDKLSISETKAYLKVEWPRIKAELLDGRYKPSPILRVEIPKSSGGIRKLGIPTVTDRLIQQAILQVLQGYIDQTFNDKSYGFRPRRSAHEAIKQSQKFIREGNAWVVDIDLEKYFDTVNHDKLMSLLRGMLSDQRVLDLIRRYLNSGIDLDENNGEGVPQGSPLSPLLSNLYLNELDKELTYRKHKFVRYADDCRIFVSSERAAGRVKQSITRYLKVKLKLKVNEAKSKLSQGCEFLGYTIRKLKLGITEKNIQKFKDAIRMKTRKKGGKNIFAVVNGLKKPINGWYEYFKLQNDKSVFRSLDSWIRRRIRAYQFCAMKTGKRRLEAFLRCRLDYDTAYRFAYTNSGPWRTSKGRAMQTLLTNKILKKMGLVSLER